MSIKLGVPQGNVLGPLFFLIFINDLAFISELVCKMFADDTTLVDADEHLETLIRRFKKKPESLLEWCKFNKLKHISCFLLIRQLNYQPKLR
jgi:hypothetical protein